MKELDSYFAEESAKSGLYYDDYRFECWKRYYFYIPREAYNELLRRYR